MKYRKSLKIHPGIIKMCFSHHCGVGWPIGLPRGEYIMKAKDLMVPLADFLNPTATLKEAACLLKTARRAEARKGVKALPVLDEQGDARGHYLDRRYS